MGPNTVHVEYVVVLIGDLVRPSPNLELRNELERFATRSCTSLQVNNTLAFASFSSCRVSISQ